MEINLKFNTISKILNSNLTIDDYIILKSVENNKLTELLSWKNYDLCNLQISGYLTISTNLLTDKSKNLIKEIESEVKMNKFEELHKSLQNKLLELTGKKQKVISGKYPFLCNVRDLENKLSKVITKYKLKDFVKIESILLSHIENSHKSGFKMVQLVEYFIEKDSKSVLATLYDGWEEPELEKQVVEPKEIKDLF